MKLTVARELPIPFVFLIQMAALLSICRNVGGESVCVCGYREPVCLKKRILY